MITSLSKYKHKSHQVIHATYILEVHFSNPDVPDWLSTPNIIIPSSYYKVTEMMRKLNKWPGDQWGDKKG